MFVFEKNQINENIDANFHNGLKNHPNISANISG
jgi:hypothetical protein